MKRTIYIIMQIIIFIAILYFVYINIDNVSQLSYSQDSPVIKMSSALMIITSYFIGIIVATINAYGIKHGYKKQVEFYARKNEKLVEQNEIDNDNKEMLELKIASLELALKNAVKYRNK